MPRVGKNSNSPLLYTTFRRGLQPRHTGAHVVHRGLHPLPCGLAGGARFCQFAGHIPDAGGEPYRNCAPPFFRSFGMAPFLKILKKKKTLKERREEETHCEKQLNFETGVGKNGARAAGENEKRVSSHIPDAIGEPYANRAKSAAPRKTARKQSPAPFNLWQPRSTHPRQSIKD